MLLFTKEQMDAQITAGEDKANITFWEDDDTACEIKTDKEMQVLAANVAGWLGNNAAQWVGAAGCPACAAAIAAGVTAYQVYALASWLLSNDDFLGFLDPNTGIIALDGGKSNGSATLKTR